MDQNQPAVEPVYLHPRLVLLSRLSMVVALLALAVLGVGIALLGWPQIPTAVTCGVIAYLGLAGSLVAEHYATRDDHDHLVAEDAAVEVPA